MSNYLTAEEIFAFDDLDTIDVVVPEWGNRPIKLRALPAAEALEFAERMETPKARNAANIHLVAACAVDPKTGKRMFKPADLDKLMQKNVKAFARLARECVKLNNINENLAELEKSAKNDSSEELGAVSPTSSPVN